MKAGFTGTRWGMTTAQKTAFTAYLHQHDEILEFHHGDCVGADEDAHTRLHYGIYTIGHPPVNEARRAFTDCDEWREPKEYLARNWDIASETGMLIACPASALEQPRSGTWTTIRYARTLGKPVVIINPDGTISDGTIREETP